MIAIKENNADTVEVIISDAFCREDINRLTSVLRTYARDSVRARLLLVVRNFRGWYGAGPWWSDLTLTDECSCKLSFQRIALAGHPRWKAWMQIFISSLPAGEIQFFAGEEIAHARRWLGCSEESKDGGKTLIKIKK
jgi:hypothetical protein